MIKTTWIHGLCAARSPELRRERREEKGATGISPASDLTRPLPWLAWAAP